MTTTLVRFSNNPPEFSSSFGKHINTAERHYMCLMQFVSNTFKYIEMTVEWEWGGGTVVRKKRNTHVLPEGQRHKNNYEMTNETILLLSYFYWVDI